MDRRQGELMAAESTCEWLSRHSTFQQWLHKSREILWIKGTPGAGKSTLLEYALRNQSMLHAEDHDRHLVLSFFFTARGNELQKTSIGLFRSIAHQLVNAEPISATLLVQTYAQKSKTVGEHGKEWTWTLRELQDLILKCLERASRSVYIMIDAIDECGEEGAINLVRYFFQASKLLNVAESRLHICFSCRHYPIGDRYSGLEIEVQKENTRDIETYLHQELDDLGQSATKVITSILERSSGIFQWAALVVGQIKRRLGRTEAEIVELINKLPSTLEELYKDLLSTLDQEDRSKAFDILQWICFAKEPLTLADLRFALAVDVKTPLKKVSEIYGQSNFIKGVSSNFFLSRLVVENLK